MATTPNDPLSAHFSLLRAVVHTVSVGNRLSATDAEDFAQHVHLRLLERQHDVFTRFSGRSSLKTYLTVVVTRLLLDWRVAAMGKWRPSAAAIRLGGSAVELDRLMSRDGYSIDQAVETLSVRGRQSPAELRAIAERLPARRRPRFVSDAGLDNLPCPDTTSVVTEMERNQVARQTRSALARAYRQLPPGDRRLLSLRYARALPVVEIGRLLQMDAKRLYRRFDTTLQRLRQALASEGVSA